MMLPEELRAIAAQDARQCALHFIRPQCCVGAQPMRSRTDGGFGTVLFTLHSAADGACRMGNTIIDLQSLSQKYWNILCFFDSIFMT